MGRGPRVAGEMPALTAVQRRELRLLRFRQPYRSYIKSLTSCSQHVEDLCESFPALLFALVTGYGTKEGRELAFDLIAEGAPLKSAAGVLGLPLWTRKLSAQSLTKPFVGLPDSGRFNKEVTNHIPRVAMLIPRWMETVSLAHAACGDDYALWVARHYRGRILQRRQRQAHALVTAFVWYSAMPTTLGHKLIRKPWSQMMSMSNVLDEVGVWLKRIDLAVQIGDGVRDTWLAGGKAMGYEFVPLRTIEDFLNEARVMENCLDRYSDQISFDSARVFSIRKEGEVVADIEIGPHEDDYRMPSIDQLKSKRNGRVDPEIWRAAYAWLGDQTLPPLPADLGTDYETQQVQRKSIWAPFLDSLVESPLHGLAEEIINGGLPLDLRHSSLSDVFDSLTFDLLIPQR